MTSTETIRTIYRETVAAHGDHGIKRETAIGEAAEVLLEMHQYGELIVDVKRAIRAELMKADERDGKSADAFLRRMAVDGLPLIDDDLDVVVTLGGGLRKPWRRVTSRDVREMMRVRMENYRSVKASYKEFEANASALLQVLASHRTVEAAHAAGAFVPEAVGS
ncbi:MAG: hypothetical protein WDA07_05445 [Leucobacter sp.]